MGCSFLLSPQLEHHNCTGRRETRAAVHTTTPTTTTTASIPQGVTASKKTTGSARTRKPITTRGRQSRKRAQAPATSRASRAPQKHGEKHDNKNHQKKLHKKSLETDSKPNASSTDLSALTETVKATVRQVLQEIQDSNKVNDISEPQGLSIQCQCRISPHKPRFINSRPHCFRFV